MCICRHICHKKIVNVKLFKISNVIFITPLAEKVILGKSIANMVAALSYRTYPNKTFLKVAKRLLPLRSYL